MNTTPFDADLPLAKAWTIPSEWYLSRAAHEAEKRHVFRETWQYVGRRALVAEPGQFLTADIAGEPVLVVRQKDGGLVALANVCRHRAARVETRECGHARHFRCRYHGWAYDIGGRLAGAPDFDGVEDFCKEDFAMPRYQAAEWGPFVFVHLGEPNQSLAELMRPVAERTGIERLAGLSFHSRRVYEMQCNWKIFIDNYLDGGYHVPTLHPGLAKSVDMNGYHTVIDGLASVQISPLRQVNPVRSGDAAHYWWVHPNLMINAYEGTMDLNLVLPVAPDKCLCIFEFYFADVASPEAARYIDSSLEVAHQVQLEDQEICEEVQRGLGSASYDRGRFSVRRESGGHHFHALLAKTLKASGDRLSDDR